jgi:hypothetical protein
MPNAANESERGRSQDDQVSDPDHRVGTDLVCRGLELGMCRMPGEIDQPSCDEHADPRHEQP